MEVGQPAVRLLLAAAAAAAAVFGTRQVTGGRGGHETVAVTTATTVAVLSVTMVAAIAITTITVVYDGREPVDWLFLSVQEKQNFFFIMYEIST